MAAEEITQFRSIAYATFALEGIIEFVLLFREHSSVQIITAIERTHTN